MASIGRQFAGALKRLGGDEELLRELAGYFEEDAAKLLDALQRGVADGNVDAIRRAAHSLRSLVANFDAEQATSLSRSIEQLADKGDLQAVSAALTELEVEIHMLRGAMESCFPHPLPPTCRK